jgi:D-lactate dehydrogenase (cytochrome)
MQQLFADLRRIVGANAVITDRDALRTYDADASMVVSHAPQVVVLPSTPEQVAAVVRCAAEYDLPVVARGAGTGIAGGAIPLRGGVLLSTARLDRIEEIDTANRWAVVQAGVVNSDLNARLAPLGYQFAPDPSSQRASTIGGNLATNAGGPHCLKYGVTTNHILALEIVLHDGTLLWTGDGVAEAAGYDLTGLIVGSEGTFGVVTRAKVRLTRLPEANRVVLALFPGVVQASAAVSQIIAAGHAPTSLEVMDHNAIRAVNTAYGLGLPEAEGTTLLIIEVDGVLDGLDAALSEVLDICEEQQAFDLRPARTAEEQARVWVARKSVAGAIGRLAPAYYLVDAVVPRTRLPMMMEHVERLRREHRLEVCNVFHAGDGNLHPLVLYDPRDPDQVERAHAIAVGVLRLSIEQGGVISGEHGIGVEKQEYLPLLMSEADLALHATVYNVFNPADRFNPAKIFPADISPRALAEQRRERIVHRRPTTDNRRPTEISYQSVVGRQSSVVNREMPPLIGIIMGSDSDLPTMQPAAEVCTEFAVAYELRVVSAHRTPADMAEYASTAHSRGLKVIIAGAGGAAHLPGMVAAYSPLPVIGVPVQSKALSGLDSLLSIVQMPAGVPVATVAVGGGRNAGLLAVQILACADSTLLQKLIDYKQRVAEQSRAKNANLTG